MLVDKVYEYLLRMLATGEWPPGARVPSMRRLGSACGASRRPVVVAVRRAADQGLVQVRSRRGVTVRPGAAERAQQLLAEQARQATLKHLALLIPQAFMPVAAVPFYGALTVAVTRRAAARGLRAEVVGVPSGRDDAFSRRVVRRFDAAFAIGFRPQELVTLSCLAEQRFPTLLAHRRVPGIDLPTVFLDYDGAASRIAEHLHALGHRNVCMMAATRYEVLYGRPDHVDGWMRYLTESGLIDTCTLPVLYCRSSMVPMLMERVLQRLEGLTALVLDMGTMLEFIRNDPRFDHLEIPGRLSLASLGSTRDIPWPDRWPPVTSFEVDVARVAEVVVERIGEMIGGDLHPPNLRVPVKLHLTESVGPPPPG